MTIGFNTLFAQRDVRETPVGTQTQSMTIIAPIGTILPWLKSYTNTPATLPTSWVECDGSVLSDADSVYNGQTLPDLNGDNQFVRGNSTSGGTGGSSTHTLTTAEMPAHTHTTEAVITLSAGASRAHGSNFAPVDNNPATSSTGGGNAHENKPPYYDVVWIIRIK